MIKELKGDIRLINGNEIKDKVKNYKINKTRTLTICFKFEVGDQLYVPSTLMKGVLETDINNKFNNSNNLELREHLMESKCLEEEFFRVQIIECIGNYGYGTEVSYECKIIYNSNYLKYKNGEEIKIILPEVYLISKSELDAYIEMDRKCYVSEGYNSILSLRYGAVSPLSEESKCLKIIGKISTWTDFVMEEIEVPDEIEGILEDGSTVTGNIDAVVTLKGKDFVEAIMRVKYKEGTADEILADYKINY